MSRGIAIVLFLFSSASALDITTHCAYKKLHDVIINNGLVGDVREAWQTVMYAYPFTAHEKQELRAHAMKIARQEFETCEVALTQANIRQSYRDYVQYGAALTLSLYAMAGVVAVVLRQISLELPSGWYFFPVAKLIHRYYQGAGSAFAGVQFVSGCTLAPYGAWWASNQLLYGPSRIQILKQRKKQLQAI